MDREKAVQLVKDYASNYKSVLHYNTLGGSCVATATKTIDRIISSASYLERNFIMPDEIDIEKVAEWLMKNRDLDCNQSILTIYLAAYTKKKINRLYRDINKGIMRYTFARNPFDYEKECAKRKEEGIKVIRD
ncbi:hypothetical protein RZN25_14645 [Bacillaceae bacterium S4-13-56]